MKEFWDSRYQAEAFAYGMDPSKHLVNMLPSVPQNGKILFVAEGEGRNAVFAAKQGYDVFAFDLSEEGKKKALQLAEKHDVQMQYTVCGVEQANYPDASFDAIVMVYAHFPKEMRQTYHEKIVKWLKPGGLLIIEGFNKQQLKYSTINPKSGGPKDIDMLYSANMLTSDFGDLETVTLKESVEVLAEGEYHQGEASLIRFAAKK